MLYCLQLIAVCFLMFSGDVFCATAKDAMAQLKNTDLTCEYWIPTDRSNTEYMHIDKARKEGPRTKDRNQYIADSCQLIQKATCLLQSVIDNSQSCSDNVRKQWGEKILNNLMHNRVLLADEKLYWPLLEKILVAWPQAPAQMSDAYARRLVKLNVLKINKEGKRELIKK